MQRLILATHNKNPSRTKLTQHGKNNKSQCKNNETITITSNVEDINMLILRKCLCSTLFNGLVGVSIGLKNQITKYAITVTLRTYICKAQYLLIVIKPTQTKIIIEDKISHCVSVFA